jgi:hypothetical protein
MDVQWNSVGTGIVDLTITGGTCYDYNTYSLTVYQQIAPTISGPTAVCDNDSGMYVVYWNRGPGFGITYYSMFETNGFEYASSQNFLPNNWVEDTLWIDWSTVPFGTPKLVWFDYWLYSTQCVGTDTLHVGSNSLAQANLGPDFSFCNLSNTYNLNPGGGFSSYLWNTNATSQQISVMNPGTYSVSATDANGCVDQDTIVLTQQPANAALGPDQTVCQGTSVTLNAGPGYTSYLWSDNSTGQTLATSMPGQYSVTVTDAASCTDSDTINIFNNPLPTVSLGPDQTVCPGTPVVLDAGPGFSGYLWWNNSTGQTLTANFPGAYRVTVTDANGCIGRDTVVVSNHTVQAPNLGPNQIVCPGITAIFDAGPGYSSYLWSNASTGQTLTTSTPGNYSVTVTDGNGCTSSDAAILSNFAAPPTVNLGPDQTVCPGASVTFNAGPGFSSYLWSNASTGQMLTTSVPGTYSVTATNSNGCTSTDAVILFNFPAPAVNLGPDQTVCSGASVTFNAGPGFSSYLWSNASTAQTLTTSIPGNYSVTVTDANNCTGTDAVLLSNFPAPAVNLGPDQTVCPGASVTFNAGPGFSSYLWSNFSTGQTLTTSVPGNYSVTVVDANNCSASDAVVLFNYPAPVVNLGPDQTVCPGASVTFNAGPGFSNYLWSNFSTGQTLTTSVPGNYSVTVVDVNNCSASDAVVLFNYPAPTITLGADTSLCPDTLLLLDPGPGFSSYLWSDNSTGQTLNAVGGALYWVEVTDINGCKVRDSIQVGLLTDCIWPGDCNSDGTADNSDILSIGVAFGSSGNIRPGASQSWFGQTCPDWPLFFPGMVNYKHADSDGNGVVNNDDTLAVYNNFGLTHNRTGGAGSGIPLYLQADVDTVIGSGMISVGLYLGDAQTLADSVYGLALTLSFVPGQVDMNTLGIIYPASFLGNVGQDAISFTKRLPNQDEVHIALVRNDQENQSGQGRIATIQFRGDSSYWQPLFFAPVTLDLLGATLVQSDFTSLSLDVRNDSVIIQNPATGIENQPDRAFKVYPNPSISSFTVEIDAGIEEEVNLNLKDLAGRTVQSQEVEGQSGLIRHAISVEDLPAGVYFIEVEVGDWRAVRKVLVRR